MNIVCIKNFSSCKVMRFFRYCLFKVVNFLTESFFYGTVIVAKFCFFFIVLVSLCNLFDLISSSNDRKALLVLNKF